MTVSRLASLALLPVLLLPLSGCGAESDPPAAEGTDPAGSAGASTTAAADRPAGETRVGCFGAAPGWPASAMDGGIDPADRDGLVAALEDLVADAGIDAPAALTGAPVAEADWFVLDESDGLATVATGAWDQDGPAPDGQTVTLRRAGEQWRATGWGECRVLAPVPEPGRQWVEIRAGRDLDPASKVLAVRVVERACAGGRDPRPFLGAPQVVETEESVTIGWTSEAIDGVATCVGSAPVPARVELAAPLGDRVLLDASRWPAHPIANRT